MASIWRGALSFGLVNVGVRVHPATQDNDVAFHQVHAEDGGRIRYKRVCEVCGQIVDYSNIAKAYESDTGKTVVITEDDLASLPAARTREIEVLEFVPESQVDPILFDRTYYLEPNRDAVRPYVLLCEALQRTERIAIAQVALRTKTRLAALRVHDGVLMLQTMLWDDEVRKPDFAVLREADLEPREQELKMAASLIETLEADFHPEKYHDEYREELIALIDRKLTNNEDVVAAQTEAEPAETGGEVVDLVSALQASIERQKQRKGTGS